MCGYVAVKEPVVHPVLGEGGKLETRIFHSATGKLYPIVVFVNVAGLVCGVCDDETAINPVGETEDARIASVIEQVVAAFGREHIHEAEGPATFCGVNQPMKEGDGRWT